MQYATVAELTEFLPEGEPLPEDAQGLLDQAAENVDDALLTAVYPVDAQGMPTAPEHLDAVRRATCAQAVWLDETGDRTGAARQWSSASLGGASYQRAAGASSTGGAGGLGPRPERILRVAGLLSARVHTRGRRW